MKMRIKDLVFVAALAVCTAAYAEVCGGMQWTPSNPKICRLMPGRGIDGDTALAICGTPGAKTSGCWQVNPFVYRPDTCYGISVWANRQRTGSEIVFENSSHWKMFSAHVTSGWTELKTVFKTAPSPTNLVSFFKLWEYRSQGETLFCKPRIVELVPEWRKAEGLELGHGEFVCGNLYSFVTHLKAPACAVSRPFVGVRNGARSGHKLDMPSGAEMLYRFSLPERRFKDAEATIAGAYRKGGRVVVEASVDGGGGWTFLTSITDATPYRISFPAKMFPCPELLLRMRMEGVPKERMHIGMVGFSGHFEGRPARVAGATRFVEKDTGAVFLEAGKNDYRVATFGERLPVDVKGIAFWRASSGRKVLRDAAVPSKTADAVAVKTAANEAEAVQLVLTPEHDLHDVRVKLAGPLASHRSDKGARGKHIPASSVQVLREHYLDIDITTDQLGARGSWPDALPPQDDSCWPAKAGESMPFWIRVKPPKGTPKGIYGGKLLVEFKDTKHPAGKKVQVPFEVEVFGFTLPDKMTVMTPFGFNTNTVYRYHCATNEMDMAAIRELYLKYLADNHISPYPMTVAQPILKWKDVKNPDKVSLSIDWSAYDREIERLISIYHFNAIKVSLKGLGGGNHDTRHSRREPQIAGAKRGEPLYERLMEMYLGQVQRHFEEKGWIDKAFVYWFDEPMGQDYEYVNAGMRTLQKYAPKLKRMITNRCTEDLMDTINTWCPVPNHFHVPALAKCRARGDNMWWYICCSPPATQLGEHIDHPGTDLRTWLWMSWNEDVTGILIWAVGWWSGRAAYPDMENPQDPYVDPVGWGKRYKPGVKVSMWGNGEGRLMYPPLSARNGKQGRTVIEGPVGCIRMEMLRDGIEDYEYFAMLKRCDPTNTLLSVPKDVYRAIDDYSSDPVHMEIHREKLARALESVYGIGFGNKGQK